MIGGHPQLVFSHLGYQLQEELQSVQSELQSSAERAGALQSKVETLSNEKIVDSMENKKKLNETAEVMDSLKEKLKNISKQQKFVPEIYVLSVKPQSLLIEQLKLAISSNLVASMPRHSI
jgi:chromosome segregation ATPase